MAEEELHVVEIRDDFYRDSFGKVIFVIVSICVAIFFIVATSVYLYMTLPPPVTFPVDKEWRVQPTIAVDQPYIAAPDLLQWVSEVVPKSFTYDFNNYNDQLKARMSYYTESGSKIFLNQLNNYVDYNSVQLYKMFVNSQPAGAPAIINQGLLSGRYSWWVEIPIEISFTGSKMKPMQALTLQVLVVRVSTLDNLSGVAIDNVIVANSSGGQPAENSPVVSQPAGNG